MGRKYTLEDVKKVAEDKGGFCLETEYKNCGTPMKWKCGICGYEWKTCFKNVYLKNSWCRKCSTKNRKKVENKTIRKITMLIVNDLAKKRGGKCLETEYKHSKVNMKWQCGKCNYIWKATFSNVNSGSWCLKCAIKKQSKSIEDCLYIAEVRGGKCLSKEYKNHKTNMKWQCGKCNYIWKACYNNIRTGTWCPKCNNSKGVLEICKILDMLKINYELEKKLNYKKMRFDFFLPKYNIAIEYDGIQHFKLGTRYSSITKDFKRNREFDILKTKYCLDNRIKLVRVYYKSLNFVKDIIQEIIKNVEFKILYTEKYPYNYIIDNIKE